MISRRRNPWTDAGWLFVLCAVCFTAGLTAHGLTNWQESQRALVAREMYERGEWLVPTVHGEAYIAKPPMIYWAQMLIAWARERTGETAFADETEIRLTAALGGLLGVLATYLAGRRLLRDPRDERLGDDAAWLAALGLAGGVLYARSSRIGELDVLLVPSVVTAVAAIVHAWRASEARGATSWPALIIATIAATAAAMTKGPPALMVIALAGYGSVMLLAGDEAGRESPRGSAWAGIVGAGLLTGAAAAAAAGLEASRLMVVIGLAFFASMGAAAGVAAWRLSRPERASAWFGALRRTHPLVVLGAPAAVFWLWSGEVASRVGAQRLGELAAVEAQDNLRLLVIDSPAKNIGFMMYGVAPMSAAMLAGLVWMVRERPRLTAGQRVPIVWCGLGLAAFSALGKGVARYLTPVWPGGSLLGGLWLARALSAARRSCGHERWRWAVTGAMVASCLVQAWWYGAGREAHFASRSPRAFVRELTAGVDVDRLGVWRLSEPALDFYTGQRVERWDDAAMLVGEVRTRGAYTLISREGDVSWRAAAADAGLSVRAVDVRAAYRWRADAERVRAWRIERGGM